MTVQITIARNGTIVARDAAVARSPADRARGLLGRPRLLDGQALIFPHARQIHTVGMRYRIDVVFCDSRWTVVRIVRSMRPMRVTRWVSAARFVIELPAGAADQIEIGDRLVLSGDRVS